MNKNLKNAEEKIKREHEEFKKEIEKMEPMQVYTLSGVIIFTEATIYHINQLICEELADLIANEDATLKGAVQYIISQVRNKYGQMGDLPVEEFHQLIWDYYKIDHAAAKKAMEERTKKMKERKKEIIKQGKNNTLKKKNNQINIIDVLNTSTSNETKTDSDDVEIKIDDIEEHVEQIPAPKAGPLQVSLFDF
ncbi:hypothetical protein CLQ_14298 (plasmid) [Clostridium botulinum Af84]|uniref:Cas9 inhibitor AcrIIA9 family protein n=1 Tax=Clostridium botulinum TaxID=1491 RepID=UPI00035BA7F4|nr:Cas9 inhibitor AcrIIA9 family protein [Clostridium botulinum]APR02666.1 hypothetical protein RSJ2_3724 [Clostridium botulinum]AUN19857.1 hypothetical protein B2M06_20160 [Clostridium botulinum]EPS54465.1 hypothetical protein CLQ_14298 [Clostridium botulinum Af84]NFM82802.1 hypothetical protein [Clostridium botulinum]NFP10076.1 hypothetical protein [Clostridium botulinum]